MKKYRFQIILFWFLFSIGVISIYGVFYLASIGKFGEMPDFRQLENPKTNFASEIISSDNEVLENIILMTIELQLNMKILIPKLLKL